MMLQPHLQALYGLSGDVAVSIVRDNACSHAKPALPEKPQCLRRCSTEPDLGSKRFQRRQLQGRRLSQDDSICRWSSAPCSGGSGDRVLKDVPPVMKRSAQGPPITLAKSATIASFGAVDRPPTYARPSYMFESKSDNNKTCPLRIIQEALDHMDAHAIVRDEDNVEVTQPQDELPEEPISF